MTGTKPTRSEKGYVTVTKPDGSEASFYMDKKLFTKLMSKVHPAINRKDEDYVLNIDGEERGGKSVLAMQVGIAVDPSLNLDRICFSPDEFRNAVSNAKTGQCVIFDEAYSGMGASSTLSSTNKIIKSMMMEMGQKNLFVIIVLPTFFDLDRYAAIWRTRQLIHVYRHKGQRGRFIVFGKKSKKYMYLMGKKMYDYKYGESKTIGRFYNQYVVDQDDYRKKKDQSLKTNFSIEKKTKYHVQRDALIHFMNKELKMSAKRIDTQLKTNKIYKDLPNLSQISYIIKNFDDTSLKNTRNP